MAPTHTGVWRLKISSPYRRKRGRLTYRYKAGLPGYEVNVYKAGAGIYTVVIHGFLPCAHATEWIQRLD
jgi:hypothetical protein